MGAKKIDLENYENQNQLSKSSNGKRAFIFGLGIISGALIAQGATTNLVDKALAFKAMLSTSDQAILEQNYTIALSHKWSNLPVTMAARNGVRFADLTAPQLAAALDLISVATGKAKNQGFEEFKQIIQADSVIAVTNSNGYGKGLYYLAFLNTPSNTDKWMLQFGGHHYAANLSFSGGNVIGVTPQFRGVEPITFTATGGLVTTPLDMEKTASVDLLASLSAGEKTTAKLSSAVGDLVVGAGKDGAFPTTKAGIKIGSLTALQQEKAMALVDLYVKDLDSATAKSVRAQYLSELSETYLAYSGTGLFATSNDYIRLDGPNVWIEFLSPSGIIFRSQPHYHTIWRDRTRDYGNDLKGSGITSVLKPKRTVEFTVASSVSTGSLLLSFHNEIKNGKLTVSNMAGTRMLTLAGVSGNEKRLDISALPKGTYQIVIADAMLILHSRFTRL